MPSQEHCGFQGTSSIPCVREHHSSLFCYNYLFLNTHHSLYMLHTFGVISLLNKTSHLQTEKNPFKVYSLAIEPIWYRWENIYIVCTKYILAITLSLFFLAFLLHFMQHASIIYRLHTMIAFCTCSPLHSSSKADVPTLKCPCLWNARQSILDNVVWCSFHCLIFDSEAPTGTFQHKNVLHVLLYILFSFFLQFFRLST